MPKIYGITGRKNGGKTTLTTRLIAHFAAQGMRVAAIKRAHHAAETDHPGTDSHRMREAGAAQVILSSPARVAVMTELRGTDEPALDELIEQLAPCDLVLVEGFKQAPHPKIEAWRPETGQPPLSPGLNIAAVATNAPGDPALEGARLLNLDDIPAIAGFIAAELGLTPRRKTSSMPPGVDWLPVAEAQARLRDALRPLNHAAERLRVADAQGRVLAEDAIARRANPPAANSAVDGYGIARDSVAEPRAPLSDGRAAAGGPFAGAVPAGHALRILTGAILPEGVDTVILQEETRIENGIAHFARLPKRGANTRPAGEDMAQGAVALPAGHRLRAPDIALLSALGVAEVAARPALRIGVLSTGDEILPEPSSAALPHQIWDANRPMLLALAARWGAVPVDLGRAPDDPAAIRAALDAGAAQADLILTSGGASAGDEDHVSRLLSEQGRLSSWRIAMKPGRPLALAFWPAASGEVPVIGLPGNPVAALVCALIFARPAADLLSGAGWSLPQGFEVPAAFRKSKGPGRREYLRARLNAEGAAEVFASEGSGLISGLSWAEGLVELDDPAREIHPGDRVRFYPYASFGAG
ncbi:MAG: bifunctional molybdopterin-guanine dinucleotide biosynthesis adaptor protein MobB/molybdopterin molybdotransferase MoeA [Paracoccus sp. (in: a-proteobacteria)]|nr:bifunctional molybdopterin-guanine dinucleotide biosynthesis adaptor protein MobB/molybdopterin molybdotransferase MoeA [Paracoccus sp. (in: a-proteobacteria)]